MNIKGLSNKSLCLGRLEVNAYSKKLQRMGNILFLEYLEVFWISYLYVHCGRFSDMIMHGITEVFE